MTNFISTLGVLLRNEDFLRTQNKRFLQLQYQLTTNKKFQDLKYYNIDAFRIINFSADISTRKNYVENIDRTTQINKTYDTTLNNLVAEAQNIIQATQTSRGNDAGLPSGVNVQLANNILSDIGDTLNQSFGGRYIYGGQNLSTPPVKDLTLLPTLDVSVLDAEFAKVLSYDGQSTVATSTTATGQVLPYFRNNFVKSSSNLAVTPTPTNFQFTSDVFSYLNQFDSIVSNRTAVTNVLTTSLLPTVTASASDGVTAQYTITGNATQTTNNFQNVTNLNTLSQLRVNDNRLVKYGFSPTEPGFQNLIYATLNLKAAASSHTPPLSGTEARQFVERANQLAQTALTQLRELQTDVAQVNDRLDNYQKLHQNFVTLTTTSLQNIQNADISAAAVEVSNLQTLLQASYTAIAKQQSLSLVNYLK